MQLKIRRTATKGLLGGMSFVIDYKLLLYEQEYQGLVAGALESLHLIEMQDSSKKEVAVSFHALMNGGKRTFDNVVAAEAFLSEMISSLKGLQSVFALSSRYDSQETSFDFIVPNVDENNSSG